MESVNVVVCVIVLNATLVIKNQNDFILKFLACTSNLGWPASGACMGSGPMLEVYRTFGLLSIYV